MIIVITTTAINTAAAKHATYMTRKGEGEGEDVGECEVSGEGS
jgi:hypothetical protein